MKASLFFFSSRPSGVSSFGGGAAAAVGGVASEAAAGAACCDDDDEPSSTSPSSAINLKLLFSEYSMYLSMPQHIAKKKVPSGHALAAYVDVSLHVSEEHDHLHRRDAKRDLERKNGLVSVGVLPYEESRGYCSERGCKLEQRRLRRRKAD
eukprot:CAMPEP_0170171792 /NCGR_PEP_ID=MMETSP0040_2-20121228/4983_1 /TAXON_ID=641309 /ORGANISM="Lotharella oceanica, Strain CCMP622" /LENGTH=150 /DNA_ID=CAMNT_0010412073 /DNA_START=110 /DNA_END=562 /DNA_ORIENTATION=-